MTNTGVSRNCSGKPCNRDRAPRAAGDETMSALFQLSAPWWAFVLRALAVYVLVMVLMRLSGKT
jgi:hypothetical protein